MNQKLFKYLLGIVIVAGAYYAGRVSVPQNKEEQTKTERQTDIVTVVKEITRPDGTKEKEITRTNKSNTVSEVVTKIEAKQAQHKINLGTSYSIKDATRDYTLSYERRVIQNLWAGVIVSSNQNIGVTVGLEF